MDRRLTRESLRLLESHQSFVRATVVRTAGSVPGKLGASMIIRSDGSTLGTVGGAALEEEVKARAGEAFAARRGDLYHYELSKWVEGGLPSLCGGSVDIAVEYVAASPSVLLWGGGHVAHALASIFPTLEIDYSVADDRPEWVTLDRFPTAAQREVVSPATLFDRFDPSAFTHLYLLGYDAEKDGEVLRRALERFPNYIGMISSESKRAHLFKSLRDGGVRAEALERVHAPVGLDIGAERPAEIAVSIVAEMIRQLHPERVFRKTARSRSTSEALNGRLRSP
ncbi:MAG TPA: XdhC/CoxI family protein [Thermoplasmata archaeon]|nr:XdhC/CoxI family protein [Thermoplasmata archaeon]